MTLSEAQEGRKVFYFPTSYFCDGQAHLYAIDRGIITGKNATYVFVRFENEEISKAVKAEDLSYD